MEIGKKWGTAAFAAGGGVGGDRVREEGRKRIEV